MPRGTGVSAGIGLAQAMIWQAPVAYDYIPRKCADPSKEVDRFEAARRELHSKTSDLRQRTARIVGAGEAAIFDAYKMILDDEDSLLEPLRRRIWEGHYSAEYAVTTQFDELARDFLQLEDEYMRQRVDDVFALRDQLMRELLGSQNVDAGHLDRPTVIVAAALSPADVANLDTSRVEGIVCETGGYSSHMSIIARTLGIPAVVGAVGVTSMVRGGDLVALDGETGEVWVEPDAEEIRMLRHRGDVLAEKQAEAQKFRGRPTISTDGRRIELSAIVGQLEEADHAMVADAEALGLYRTELLHVEHDYLPPEEVQYRTYRDLLERLGGKAATVRTFDDGGNKPVSNTLKSTDEENPVLGYRGVRMSLGRPSFFRTQLRALLRASAYGNLRVVFPMVSCMDELDEVLAALEQVKDELRREHIAFDEKLPVGVYIEVPAAALLSEYMAEKVDFLSIGINDLIQFTLAIDRNNPSLAGLYHMYHPSVLRLVQHTVNAAHEKGIPCMMCGEAPGQERVLPLLFGIGLDGFSVNPGVLLRFRQILNHCNYAECKMLANNLLSLNSSAEISRRLAEFPLPT